MEMGRQTIEERSLVLDRSERYSVILHASTAAPSVSDNTMHSTACEYIVHLRSFIHQASTVDNNKQYKSNHIETIIAQTKRSKLDSNLDTRLIHD